MARSVLRIARKELGVFFASPVAFIFLGIFLAVTLFVFFWVETFFARNIADVRPLFEWMPILLIFLVAALTMRMWSEERRMGTLEFLLTSPVKPLRLVLGKFAACMALVALALLLTLPLPITVSLLGNLDWGPVLGAYLATLFLAAAYTSIGLFVSSKSDNQIVSLLATVLLCAALYLVGSDALTSLVGNRAAELFKLLGSGSRFASIARGVIDLRDLYYYASIVGVFLSLNVLALETIRWSKEKTRPRHTRWRLVTALFVANFLAGNFWLQSVSWARVDVTKGHIYSISDATRSYLAQLQEPLLIRGYFSAKTHPLLAPLVPQLRDLILEYQVAGHGKVRAEFVDPLENPKLEEEAGEKYGIRPVPFQVANKYQAGLVNSYFDVLIQYGDQYEVLGFRDLIEIKARGETDLEVELRNPEYDITRSIKKVLYGFHSTGDLFASIRNPVTFTGYISPDAKLPPVLVDFKAAAISLLDELGKSSQGKLGYEIEDPEADGGSLAKEIADEYGFRPMQAGLFDAQRFYFYMTLSSAGQVVQVPLPEDLDKQGLKRSLEAGLKRFSSGFLKTIALYTPKAPPPSPYEEQLGLDGGGGKRFQLLRDKLSESHTVRSVDLANGSVPDDADLLLVVSPDRLDSKQVFAVDQFLMEGGSVILATSPFEVSLSRSDFAARKHDSGLAKWLSHNGIKLADEMVLDPQNESFPIPVKRRLGMFTVQEMQMVDYPYFVDVRVDGMNRHNALTSGIPQVTLNWPSPISIDAKKNANRTVTTLLQSSPESWTSDSTAVVPELAENGRPAFPPAAERGRQTLAVAIEGRFESFFAGKDSPLLEDEGSKDETHESGSPKAKSENGGAPVIASIIEKSPESARIILFASDEFLTDQTLNISAAGGSERFLNSLQLVEDAIDWSLEDRGLLAIRSRGHFARTLPSLDRGQQMFWEYLNYALAGAGLLLVYAGHRRSRARAELHYREVLGLEGA